MGVDPAVHFRDVSKNPIAYTGIGRSSKHRICLPVYVYLIEHPKGKIIIDTGWHSDVRVNQIRQTSLRLYLASKARLKEGEAIDEQLAKLGIKPSEIDYVFLSHLDVFSDILQKKGTKLSAGFQLIMPYNFLIDGSSIGKLSYKLKNVLFKRAKKKLIKIAEIINHKKKIGIEKGLWLKSGILILILVRRIRRTSKI